MGEPDAVLPKSEEPLILDSIGPLPMPEHWKTSFEEFFQRIRQIPEHDMGKNLKSKLYTLIQMGIFTFTLQEWCRALQISEDDGRLDITCLTQHAIASKSFDKKGERYVLCMSHLSAGPTCHA